MKHSNRRQVFSISEGNTSEGISCVIHCSLAAIQEVLTDECYVALLIGNIYKYKLYLQKSSCECSFCTLFAKVFPLESFAVYGIFKTINVSNYVIKKLYASLRADNLQTPFEVTYNLYQKFIIEKRVS